MLIGKKLMDLDLKEHENIVTKYAVLLLMHYTLLTLTNSSISPNITIIIFYYNYNLLTENT